MRSYSIAAVSALISVTLAAPAPAPVLEARQGGGKRGLVYNDAGLTNLFQGSSWAYNWAATPLHNSGGQLAGGLEYVPMLFNGEIGNWAADAAAAIASGSRHIMGFNEPNEPTEVGGTAMYDAAAAAEIFINNVTPFKDSNPDVQIGAPGISAGGIEWLRTFAQTCNGRCRCDFVPLHFYDYNNPDPAIQFESMRGWLEQTIPQVREMFGNPNIRIWVTEFAFTPFENADGSRAYMDLALPYLDNNPDIERYSYFMAGDNRMTTAGQLNAAGTRYTQ